MHSGVAQPQVAEDVASSQRLDFLKAYLRDRKTVGSITPSSAGLGRAMSDCVGASKCRAIAELGAGTGPITRALLESLPADGRLWAFEIDPRFAAYLRTSINDPRLTVVEESATEISRIAKEAGLQGFDGIVSALPFSLLGSGLTLQVLNASREVLLPGAAFVALQYHPWYLPPFLRAIFGTYERRFYPWNIPPAQLFRCRRSTPPR